MNAIAALEAAETSRVAHYARLELLITHVMFPAGTLNSVALTRNSRRKKPGVPILFIARDETGGIQKGSRIFGLAGDRPRDRGHG